MKKTKNVVCKAVTTFLLNYFNRYSFVRRYVTPPIERNTIANAITFTIVFAFRPVKAAFPQYPAGLHMLRVNIRV